MLVRDWEETSCLRATEQGSYFTPTHFAISIVRAIRSTMEIEGVAKNALGVAAIFRAVII